MGEEATAGGHTDSNPDTVFHFTGGETAGEGDYSVYHDRILRYNPSTDTWTEVGQLTEAKYYHASTAVADISGFFVLPGPDPPGACSDSTSFFGQ